MPDDTGASPEGRKRRSDQPPAILWRTEQRGKARRGIETGPAQPVNRAVGADQGCRFAVADMA